MQALSAIVVLVNLVLAALVGVRLLRRAGRNGATPERALGVYFVASPFVAALVLCAAYAGLSDPALLLPDPWMRLALGTAAVTFAVGAGAILVFIRTTFRPDERWARHAVHGFAAILVIGLGLEAFQDGFALMLWPGTGHWLGWAGRTLPLAWLSIECFRHWFASRKRLRLGLTDPLVVDRFLLWGVFSASAFCTLASDLLARGTYVLVAGTTQEIIPDVAAAVVDVTIPVTMVLGMISCATLVLAFFPTRAYLEWIGRRAARARV